MRYHHPTDWIKSVIRKFVDPLQRLIDLLTGIQRVPDNSANCPRSLDQLLGLYLSGFYVTLLYIK